METIMESMTKSEREEAINRAILAISNGEMIEIANASWCANELSIGDFRECKWSSKYYDRDGEVYYHWHGAGPVMIDGRIYQRGDYVY